MSFIISNSDNTWTYHQWKCTSCFNNVMKHVDNVIKRDVYPQKMHSCSKNIRALLFIVLKISVVYQKIYIIGVLHRYSISKKIKGQMMLAECFLRKLGPSLLVTK